MSEEAPYRVHLDVFEGPLDLLLHLCRRQEVDIREISIAAVTEQYLAYLDLMEQLNLEVAGTYLAMAATLCQIKSYMLLPRPPAAEQEEQGPDPAAELIRRLLEYERFKQAAAALRTRPVLDRDSFEGPARRTLEDDVGGRPIEGSLFLMLDALRELLAARGRRIEEHRVELTRFTVGGRMRAVAARMRHVRTLRFGELFDEDATRAEILVTFLALLEMIRLQHMSIRQRGHLGAIQLTLLYEGEPDELPIPGEELDT